MPMTDRLKILSVGGGWVVNNRHLPSITKNPDCRLIGVVSNQPARAESTAKKFRVANYHDKMDFQIGWQAEADAVMIGTVPDTHYDLARMALEAGKHVLVEKPMTLNTEQGRMLAELAKKNNRVLAVVHNFQFSRAAHAFRRAVAAGKIGRIRAVYGVQLCNHKRNIPAWCDELPLGLFFDESPHFYYLFRWLTSGHCELLNASVWRSKTYKNTPRFVSAEYVSADNFPVYLHINFDSSLTEWHVLVVGDKGTMDIDVWRDIPIYLPNDGVHTAVDISRTSMLSIFQHGWGFVTGGLRYAAGRHLYGNPEVLDRFVRAIRGEDSLTGMNPDEGIAVVGMQRELIEKAQYRD